jgi:8-oxo-dGTP diphosphatase
MTRMGWLSLPKGVLGVVREVGRHILRRPVVGIVAAAHTKDGRWLFIRRADTGTWCMPGGTLEWGETLRVALKRELDEEAGVDESKIERVVGIYSRPDRDIRFHAVTIVVVCEVNAPTRAPKNPAEIREAKLFAAADVPRPLAMSMDDVFDDVLRNVAPIVE